MRKSQQEALQRYVDSMLKDGFSTVEVKEQLAKHHYPKQVIEQVFSKESQALHQEQSPAEEMHPGEKVFFLCFGIALLLFVMWTGLMSDASVFVVFISFVPTFTTMVAAYIMFSYAKRAYRYYIWLIPVVMVILMTYTAASGLLPPLQNTAIGNIAALNIVLSGVFLFIVTILPKAGTIEIQPKAKKKAYYEPVAKKKHKATGSLQELQKHIQSIEEKAKALNFVIGRVYSTKHGGSPAMRDKLKIKSEWYNEFQELQKSGDVHFKIGHAKQLLHKMYTQLQTLMKTEEQVFGHLHHGLKNITRDPQGTSRIIDILIVNDDDPVQSYFQSAIEFCLQAVQELKVMEARGEKR